MLKLLKSKAARTQSLTSPMGEYSLWPSPGISLWVGYFTGYFFRRGSNALRPWASMAKHRQKKQRVSKSCLVARWAPNGADISMRPGNHSAHLHLVGSRCQQGCCGQPSMGDRQSHLRAANLCPEGRGVPTRRDGVTV